MVYIPAIAGFNVGVAAEMIGHYDKGARWFQVLAVKCLVHFAQKLTMIQFTNDRFALRITIS